MRNAARSGAKPAFALRSMSGLLDKKEMAEESKFIRSMEARRQEEIRKNVERILALEDGHEEKKELVDLLGKHHQTLNIIFQSIDSN
jgi:hypothetical protein